MKEAVFLGDALKALRAFPADARRMAGRQIDRVQRGQEPGDWKPLSTIGSGVREIRIKERSGAFRVIYLATLPDVVLVIAAFRKTSQKTPKGAVDKARDRLRAFLQEET
jgi:phage-related protein